jgi:hypothetical protein
MRHTSGKRFAFGFELLYDCHMKVKRSQGLVYDVFKNFHPGIFVIYTRRITNKLQTTNYGIMREWGGVLMTVA